MANRQYKQSDILKAIQLVPKWLLVKRVMDGESVEDAGTFQKGDINFEVVDGRATWDTPSTTIVLRQLPGGDFHVGVGTNVQTVKSLSLAAMRFVVLVWDLGCRGVG
jgi:hypothetical protein